MDYPNLNLFSFEYLKLFFPNCRSIICIKLLLLVQEFFMKGSFILSLDLSSK